MLQGEEIAYELAVATGVRHEDALTAMRYLKYAELIFMLDQLDLLKSTDLKVSFAAAQRLQSLVDRSVLVAQALSCAQARVCRFETVRPNPAFL